MTVLITGGHSARTLKLLKAFPGHQILLGGYGEMPALQTTDYRFVSLGDYLPESLAHQLLQSCLDHGADAILPLQGDEMIAVSASAVLFEEFGIRVLLPVAPAVFIPDEPLPAAAWSVWLDGRLLAAHSGHVQPADADTSDLHGAYLNGTDGRLHLFTVSTYGL